MKRIEQPGENHEKWYLPTIYHATSIADLLDPASRKYAFNQAVERYEAKLSAKVNASHDEQLASTLVGHPWTPHKSRLTIRGKENFINAAGLVVLPRVSHNPQEDKTGAGRILLQDKTGEIDVETIGGPYNPHGAWIVIQLLKHLGLEIQNPADLKGLDWTGNAVLLSRFTESLKTGETSDYHGLIMVDNDLIRRTPILSELGRLIQQGLFGLQPQTNEFVR